jgi:hypothetical protein
MLTIIKKIKVVCLIFLLTSCSQQPLTTRPSANPLPATHAEDRMSQSPAGTIVASLNKVQFHDDSDICVFSQENICVVADSEFLLTIANSTQESIWLYVQAGEHCFADSFWFYRETEMGWQPMQPFSSFKCFPLIDTDVWIEIPGGLEKEFDLSFLLGSRGLLEMESGNYLLRVRYLDANNQVLFVFTDQFQIGPDAYFDESLVTVKNAASLDTSLYFTNNSDQSLWLSSMCPSIALASGWMDEINSGLQRLTEENSWLDIRAEEENCSEVTELIEIEPGETRLIDGTIWLQDAELTLPSGYYRWDLIYYLNNRTLGVEHGRHTFSEIFEYRE